MGLRMDRFAKLVKVVRERVGRWLPVVSAAGGPGAAGGGVLPDQPHDAAARPALRGLFGDGLPGHPAAAAPAGVGAGPRPVADVERLWIVDGTLIPIRD